MQHTGGKLSVDKDIDAQPQVNQAKKNKPAVQLVGWMRFTNINEVNQGHQDASADSPML